MNIAYRENIAAREDAADYRFLEVRPLTGALGAELFGVDLSEDLPDEAIAEIRAALLRHLVVFFRGQRLAPERHRAFGRRFGELHIHEYVKGMDDFPEVMRVVKTEADRFNFGGTWHSDVSYHATPPLGSILYALEVPATGGDTLFANQYLAYETLSDGTRDLLEGRRAVHSAEAIYGAAGAFDGRYKSGAGMAVRETPAAFDESEHPVFRTHPETGRKALYVNGNFTTRLSGMTAEESAPILQRLHAHATIPDFCCRFRWEAGSVAFWDNRCVQHYAVNDYAGKRRVMHRVTVMGDRPR